MASRKTILATGETYHIFNRSIAKQPIFTTASHYRRMLELIHFYIFQKPALRFSHYKRLATEQKTNFFDNLQKSHKQQVEIYTYCLMPNHFHFLLKQTEDQGIAKFMSNIQNGYAKYLNIKHHRSGAVFQEQFKAVRIETDEQLQHVMRYIILNPYTSFLVKDIRELEKYPWSSFYEYTKKGMGPTKTNFIMNHFRSVDKLKEFIFDQADYQRELDEIKHLTIE